MRRLILLLLAGVLAGCGAGSAEMTLPVSVPPGPPAAAKFPLRQHPSAKVTLAAQSTVNLNAGWNAVAFDAPQVTALSGSSIAGLAWWDGTQYQFDEFSESAINAGDGGKRGFWVFANNATSFGYTGSGGSAPDLTLRAGWNLISLAGTGQVAGNALIARVGGNVVPLNSVVFTTFTQLDANGGSTPINVQSGGVLSGGRAYWCYSTTPVSLSWTLAPPPSPGPSAVPSPTPTPAPTAPYLRFASLPAQVPAGADFTVGVEVVSPAGTRLQKVTGQINLTSSQPLSGQLSQPLVNGLATFTVSTSRATGSLRLTAVAPTLSLSVQSLPISIPPAPISQLLFGNGPSNTTAGVGFNPPVFMVFADQYNNVVIPNPPVNVTLASNKHDATLVNKTVTTNATTGWAVFPELAQTRADAGYTLQATAQLPGGPLQSLPSGDFTVFPASGSTLSFVTPPPANLTAGAPVNVSVEVKDAFGNRDTSFTNWIRLAINAAPSAPNSADLFIGDPGDSQRDLQAAAGVATFTVNPNNAGNWTVQASSDGLSPNLNWSFAVSANADRRLVFAQQPLGGTAGVSINPVVQLRFTDSCDNPVLPPAPVPVILTSNKHTATFTGNTSETDPDTGVAFFPSLQQTVADSNYILTATATLSGNVHAATSTSFNVGAASGLKLAFHSFSPSPATAGQISQLKVRVLDQFDNLVTNSAHVVSLTLTSAPSMPGRPPDLDVDQADVQTSITTIASNGEATFNVKPNNAGAWNVQAWSDDQGGLTPVNATFSVQNGPPVTIGISQSPVRAVAGVSFPMQASLRDAYNNQATTVNTGRCVLSLNPGNGQLTGDTDVNWVNGYALMANVVISGAHPATQVRAADSNTAGAVSGLTTAFRVTSEIVSRDTGHAGAVSTSPSYLGPPGPAPAAQRAIGGRRLSADGRYCVFITNGIPVPGVGTVAARQIWRRDRSLGLTELVSTGGGYTHSSTDCSNPAISPDGRFVAFSTNGMTSPSVRGILYKDMQGGALGYVSSSSAGTIANGDSDICAITNRMTVNGTTVGPYVAFHSVATNLVPSTSGHAQQIYRKDTWWGACELVSRRNGGAAGEGSRTSTWNLDISSDGRYVSFYASSNTDLIDGVNWTAFNQIYRRDMNSASGVELVSRRAGGGALANGNWHSDNSPCRISADGRYISYVSSATDIISPTRAGNQPPNATAQVYVRDMDPTANPSGASILVSRKNGGAANEACNTDASGPDLAPDASTVCFHSAATDLVSAATSPTVATLFRRRLSSGVTSVVSKNLLTDAFPNGECLFPSMNLDGTVIQFETFATNLGINLGSATPQIVVEAAP